MSTLLSTREKVSEDAAKKSCAESPGARKTFWKPNNCFRGALGTWVRWRNQTHGYPEMRVIHSYV